MTATSPYLNRRPRAFEEVVCGRRCTAPLGGPADPRELGKIIAAIPGKVLVRFANRSEWRRLEQLEILS